MTSSDHANKLNLLGKSIEELRALAVSLGEPAYRGGQLYHAFYAEKRFDISAMANLPAAFRHKLQETTRVALPKVQRRYPSADGTMRYVLAIDAPDDSATNAETTIETVFMPEENRQTICISTQAGCAVDCGFCLTATLGLIRNLSAGEMLGQVLVALDDHRAELKPRTNIVLMGQSRC
jgi:23S rRNA (adenine2503-C2)-methyltransferase